MDGERETEGGDEKIDEVDEGRGESVCSDDAVGDAVGDSIKKTLFDCAVDGLGIVSIDSDGVGSGAGCLAHVMFVDDVTLSEVPA